MIYNYNIIIYRERDDEELKKNDRHGIVSHNNNNKILRVHRNDIIETSRPGEADAPRQESR